MNVAETKEKLGNGSVVIKNQGYVHLLKSLQCMENSSTKCREEWIKLYFDTFGDFGRIVCGWSQSSIQKLIAKGVFSTECAINECLLQLDRNGCCAPETIKAIFSLAPLQLNRLSYLVLRKERFTDLLINELALSKNESSIVYSLFFCSSLTKPERILLADRFLKNLPGHFWIGQNISSEGSSYKEDDLFSLAADLYANPEILLEHGISSHHLLIPVVLSCFTVWGELEKSCPGAVSSQALQQCRAFLSECLKVDTSVKVGSRVDVSHSLMDALHTVSNEKETDLLVSSWRYILEYKESSLVCEDESLLFVCALLPHSSEVNKKNSLDLLSKICRQNESLSHLLFPVLMVLYTKPYIPVDKSTVLHSMMSIINRAIVPQVVKFFCIVSQQKTLEKDLAMKFLGELVVCYPTIVNELLPLVKIVDSDEDSDVERKISLMHKIFEATDQAEDELLPLISALLKTRGYRLSLAVRLVTYLVQEDILDIVAVRRQLSKTVRINGNEQALIEYCKLLGIAGKLKLEEGAQDPRSDCIAELWQLTQSQGDMKGLVSKAAWESLSNFSSTEISEFSNFDWDSLLLRCNIMTEVECEGFTKFLNRMLSFDVELLSRPLYTKKFEKDDVALSNVFSWFDVLSRTNAESPWFWRASLGLFPAINSTTPAARRYAASMKLFRRLILEVIVSPDIDMKETVFLFAAWRTAVSEALNLLAGTKNNDFIWARDQICEECQRALRQTELSLPNVVMVLTSLASIMKMMISEADCSSHRQLLESSTKAWLSSVVSFVMSITNSPDDDFKPLSPPIFAVDVNADYCSTTVHHLCDYLLCAIQMEFFEPCNLLTSTGNNTDWLPEDDVYSTHIRNLLVDSANSFSSRSELLITSTSFGIDSIIVSRLEAQLEDPSEQVDVLKTILDSNREISGDNLEKVMHAFSASSGRHRRTFETALRRFLDRRWTLSNECKRAIFEGLAYYCVAIWNSSKDCLPVNYDALPESSLLRKVVTYISKDRFEGIHLCCMIDALAPLKREDGRSLPALDWYTLLYDKLKTDIPSFISSTLRLACQENDSKLVNGVLGNSPIMQLSDNETCIVVENLSLVLKSLPQKEHFALIQHIINLGLIEPTKRGEVVSALSKVQQQTSVFRFLKEHLPTFGAFCSNDLLNNIFLDIVSDAVTFRNLISRSFDVWLECNHKPKVDMVFLLGEVELAPPEERDSMYRIVGLASTCNGEAFVITSIMNLISVHNISVKTGVYRSHIFELFLVLLCALEAPVPFSWTGTESVLEQCLSNYRRFLIRWCSEGRIELLMAVRRFLISHLMHEENETKIAAVRDIVLIISSHQLFTAAELSDLDNGVIEHLFCF